MARYKVKKFGKYGLHIILRKADGYKEGQEVEVLPDKRQKYKQNHQPDSVITAILSKKINAAFKRLDNIENRINNNGSIREQLIQEIKQALLRDEEFMDIIYSRLRDMRRF